MLPAAALFSRALAAAARARRGPPALSALAPPALLARLAPGRPASSGTAAPSPRRLGDILHLDKLTEATGPEIAAIWTDFHDASKKGRAGDASTSAASASPASTPHAFRLGSTMAADAYAAFKARAAASPLLALPVAKPSECGGGAGDGGGSLGSLTLLVQAQLPHLLIGTLGEYQAAGPSAPAHAVVTHYDELAEDKGVVLVRTDLVSPHVLTPAEAAAVVATIHRLYCEEAGHALVRAFNHAPATFDWDALCKHVGVEAGGGGG